MSKYLDLARHRWVDRTSSVQDVIDALISHQMYVADLQLIDETGTYVHKHTVEYETTLHYLEAKALAYKVRPKLKDKHDIDELIEHLDALQQTLQAHRAELKVRLGE